MDVVAGLHAYLSYRDAPNGLRWLRDVGFEIVSREDGPSGTVLHAEVRLGDVALVASTCGSHNLPTLTRGTNVPSVQEDARLLRPRTPNGERDDLVS